MANNVVGSLIVNLGLETGRLNSDTDKAAKHFNSFEKKAGRSLNKIKRGVDTLTGVIGGLTGILGTLSVAGLGVMAKNAIDSADKIAKLSDKLGVSTESLSQYQHVAELSGVTFDNLTIGWQRMTRRVAEAAQGTGEAKAALHELNLDAQQLTTLSPDKQFEKIADALNGLTSQSDKVRLAFKLFDSGGVSLLQTMGSGSEGIKKMREEADKLGLTLTGETAQSAEDANDALTRLTASGKGLGLSLVSYLGPAIADVADWLSLNIPAAVNKTINTFKELRIGLLSLSADALAFVGADELSASVRGTADRLLAELLAAQNKVKRTVEAGAITPQGKSDTGPTGPTEAEQKALDNLVLSLMTEEERLLESYNRRKEIVATALGGDVDKKVQHDELMKQLAIQYQSDLTRIEQKGWSDRQKFSALSAKNQTKSVLGEMINLTAGVSQHSKKMFNINKAAGMANAVINTYEGVSKSLSTYPWPLAGAMAALHLAAGLAQVNAIKSTSFGATTATASIPSGAGLTRADDPAIVQPDAKDKSGSQINVYIQGSAIGNEDVRRVIVKAIEEAQSNDELILRAG